MLVDEYCLNIIEHLILFGIPLSTCSISLFTWIHMNGCPWNEDTDWLPRIVRWGDNRYIWLAVYYGRIKKNADLVIGSLAKFQEQIEEEERQRDIERRWQRFEEMNDNKRRRTY